MSVSLGDYRLRVQWNQRFGLGPKEVKKERVKSSNKTDAIYSCDYSGCTAGVPCAWIDGTRNSTSHKSLEILARNILCRVCNNNPGNDELCYNGADAAPDEEKYNKNRTAIVDGIAALNLTDKESKGIKNDEITCLQAIDLRNKHQNPGSSAASRQVWMSDEMVTIINNICNPTLDGVIKCCLGVFLVCGEYKPGATVCNLFMDKYCKDPKTRNSQACNCINSTLPQPECTDIRCTSNPNAYQTSNMLANKPCKTQFLNCQQIVQLGDNVKNVDVNNVQFDQKCSLTNQNAVKIPIFIYILIIVIVLGLAVVAYFVFRKKKVPKKV